MAINIHCCACKTEFRLGLRKCPKCSDPLGDNKRYKVSVKLPDGKWFKRQVDSLDAAQKLERKVRNDIFEKKHFDIQKSPTFGDVWELYEKWARENKKSWKNDLDLYRLHIQAHLEKKDLSKVKPADVEAVLQAMREKLNPKGNSYAPATVKHVLVQIKRVVNWAIEQELYAGKNPCKSIKLPFFDNRVTSCLSKEEIQRLLKALEKMRSKRAALAIAFALYSGRRKGEILSLTWADVKIDSGIVVFKGQNTKNKTTQSVPVNSRCLEILQKCLELRNGEHIFTNGKGEPYTCWGLNALWMRLRAKARLEGFRFHDLRHTYASHLASSGQVDIYTLQNLLGHKSLSMTARYAHLADDALRRATEVASSIDSLQPA